MSDRSDGTGQQPGPDASRGGASQLSRPGRPTGQRSRVTARLAPDTCRPPDDAWTRAKVFLRQYGLLLVPVVVVAALGTTLVVRLAMGPAPVRPGRRPPGSGPMAVLARMATAPDIGPFVGKLVTLLGTIVELSAERDRVLARQGDRLFAGRSATLPEGLDVGDSVEVSGVVVSRVQGVVVLLTRRVETVAPSGPVAASPSRSPGHVGAPRPLVDSPLAIRSREGRLELEFSTRRPVALKATLKAGDRSLALQAERAAVRTHRFGVPLEPLRGPFQLEIAPAVAWEPEPLRLDHPGLLKQYEQLSGRLDLAPPPVPSDEGRRRGAWREFELRARRHRENLGELLDLIPALLDLPDLSLSEKRRLYDAVTPLRVVARQRAGVDQHRLPGQPLGRLFGLGLPDDRGLARARLGRRTKVEVTTRRKDMAATLGEAVSLTYSAETTDEISLAKAPEQLGRAALEVRVRLGLGQPDLLWLNLEGEGREPWRLLIDRGCTIRNVDQALVEVNFGPHEEPSKYYYHGLDPRILAGTRYRGRAEHQALSGTADAAAMLAAAKVSLLGWADPVEPLLSSGPLTTPGR
ncbi:MAG: hypothetical protein HY815_28210 [Candidatus Riflebacteria bacterium]|nr:hypothetical protein [Candidatus Riflebacteria bacterium]